MGTMRMRSTRAVALSNLVLVTLCLALLLLKSEAAENHVVGANFVSGALWTNDPGPSNSNLTQQYEEWAKSVTISVGDTLLFSYDDSHTVVLVPTQEMYDSCNYETYRDVTSPTPPTIYTVNDTQPLYFVCSIDKHCVQGQKVAITKILPVSSPPPPLVSAPPPGLSNGGHFSRPASRLHSYLTLASSLSLLLLVIS